MVEIYSMTQGHYYWNETLTLAAKCSWKAGPYLAEKMKNNEFAEWERVFAACVDGKVEGFCTLTEKDELPSKYEFTPFIGFVFVDAHALGYEKIYIMSGEIGFYEKYGFTKLGNYETVYGSIDQLFVKPTLL